MAATHHVGLGYRYHSYRYSTKLYRPIRRPNLRTSTRPFLLGTDSQLGITEAGLFPGVSFYLTMWYRRHEVNFRIALFFSAATIAGAFGGLLARLINLMDGVGGLEGWRWIFILEGILTFVVAVASFWMLYDYPDTAKFLTDSERIVIAERLSLDTQSLSTEFKKKCA